MKDSQATVDVSMDYKGRISVTDKLSSGTNIEIFLAILKVATFHNHHLAQLLQ